MSRPFSRLVLKFGGTSVADHERLARAAAHIKREYDAGHQVAVVVSAMGETTDELALLCRETSEMHDAREYDSVVAAGEQISAGLLAMALQKLGIGARSWLGWQIPIETDDTHGGARIDAINGQVLIERMEAGEVPVITGFQGVSARQRITTLGRGGSDTSAVAIAVALGADRCDIYTDVNGVYTADPRVVEGAHRIKRIAFEEMLELASLGARVLSVRAVELAMMSGMPLLVRSSFSESDQKIDLLKSDSLVCKEEVIMEKQTVTGIAHQPREATISLRKLPDRPGVASKVFGALAARGINIDMIIQNISPVSPVTDMTFTLPEADLDQAVEALESLRSEVPFEEIETAEDLVKVSVVGIGMRSNPGIAAQTFRLLADLEVNIYAITTSEIKISVLIKSEAADRAIKGLHAAFSL